VLGWEVVEGQQRVAILHQACDARSYFAPYFSANRATAASTALRSGAVQIWRKSRLGAGCTEAAACRRAVPHDAAAPVRSRASRIDAFRLTEGNNGAISSWRIGSFGSSGRPSPAPITPPSLTPPSPKFPPSSADPGIRRAGAGEASARPVHLSPGLRLS
jgi:hypothetical protein